MNELEQVDLMLSIVERTRNYPRLKAIHDRMMAELEAIANPPIPSTDMTEVENAEGHSEGVRTGLASEPAAASIQRR